MTERKMKGMNKDLHKASATQSTRAAKAQVTTQLVPNASEAVAKAPAKAAPAAVAPATAVKASVAAKPVAVKSAAKVASVAPKARAPKALGKAAASKKPLEKKVVHTASAPAAPLKAAETSKTNIINEPQEMIMTANKKTEEFFKNGFENVADQARETLEKSGKALEEVNDFARGNVEAVVAAGKAASASLEALAKSAQNFSRTSFEESNTVFRTMAAAKTPNELMALQNDFVKSRFDAAVGELSRTTEALTKLVGEVTGPLSARYALSVEKMTEAGKTLASK